MDYKIFVLIFLSINVAMMGSMSLNLLAYAQMNSSEIMMNGVGNMVNTNGNTTTDYNNQTIGNGTINVKSTVFNALSSKVNVSLSQAANIAEESFANNSSRAVMAQLEISSGQLVYVVCVMDPEMNLNHVYVDPGNGNILGTQKASMAEAMMMHGKMFNGETMTMNKGVKDLNQNH